MTNPDIASTGTSTRFGQPGGPDPRGNGTRAAPWSIRNTLRRLMLFPVDDFTIPSDEAILCWLAGPGDGFASLGMVVAVQRLTQALRDGNTLIDLINDVDGKLTKGERTSASSTWTPFCEITGASNQGHGLATPCK